MGKKRVVILTPTYNRAHTLEKLYMSLREQTCKDFKWMIVDDGSKDTTQELVQGWVNDDKIDIMYVKKENAGKHTALNKGIALIEEELTFIVDSDDYLTKDAVEVICQYADKYASQKEEKKLCGFCFLRHYSDGTVNVAYFNKDEFIGNYVDTRINNGLGGDKAEVFYTTVLKKYPFAEYPGEKFMPEDAVWIAMSQNYDMVHANEGIYICDYLEGGLTKSGRAMKIYSPRGMMLRSRLFVNDKRVCTKVKIKMMLLYTIYSKFAGISIKHAIVDINEKKLFVLLYIPGLIIQQIWKRQLDDKN